MRRTDRGVKVPDPRGLPVGWTWAGFNATGSDEGLHREVRRESPLAPIAGNLAVPARVAACVNTLVRHVAASDIIDITPL